MLESTMLKGALTLRACKTCQLYTIALWVLEGAFKLWLIDCGHVRDSFKGVLLEQVKEVEGANGGDNAEG
ncbi:hypothetical protein HaLaN_04078 [Haematococcus lacustris]|uniref:Uncharacterized protein n=1 Tax=Haematococcus lacustris TaxID=44745 RepID=A0A699YPZ7_HAELA|nr:hypothetical protein HaLaN_04078 [Haematococcus lacustris]